MPEEINITPYQEPDPLDIASPQQIRDSIIELNDNIVAMLKLKYAGRTFTRLILDDLERDLIQEAFAQILGEERKWYYKKQPSFFLFVLSTMRSIAWKWKIKGYGKARQHPDEKELANKVNIAASHTYSSPDSFLCVDNKLEINAVWATLLAELFSSPIAQKVLRELIQGKEQAEIMVTLGIDNKIYDSAWRQIKRVAKRMLERDKIWIPKGTRNYFPSGY
ncbi:MAG: hypothetical protein JST84_24315 [Acidobacteria bacterium]|nr:hypothetical protein [Acidobacteriota bacterium]